MEKKLPKIAKVKLWSVLDEAERKSIELHKLLGKEFRDKEFWEVGMTVSIKGIQQIILQIDKRLEAEKLLKEDEAEVIVDKKGNIIIQRK